MNPTSPTLSTPKGQTINRIQKVNKLQSSNLKPQNNKNNNNDMNNRNDMNDRKPYEFKASPYDDTYQNTTSSYGNNNNSTNNNTQNYASNSSPKNGLSKAIGDFAISPITGLWARMTGGSQAGDDYSNNVEPELHDSDPHFVGSYGDSRESSSRSSQ